jgi:hypothetical protein
MAEEHQSIMRNEVWEIVPRPKEKSVVTSKWVYKIKHVADGSMDKYKARFVARGFSQKEGEDYDETFALVARYTSIRAIISLATSMGWNLHQMDVKTAFLNGAIKEEVYIEQPQGFEVHSRDTHVCSIWPQASSKGLVCQDGQLSNQTWFFQESCRSKPLLQSREQCTCNSTVIC